MAKELSSKELKPTPKTVKFIKEVKALIETGEVASYAAIAAKLDWSATMISNIINGRQNIPNDRYRKFTEVYQLENSEVNIENGDMGGKSEVIEMSDSKEKFYMETIADLRHTAIELANANKDACIANKEASIANRILAENQRELIEILKKMHAPIVNAAKETQQVSLSEVTLDLMAGNGVLLGIWKSEGEARAVINKLCGEGLVTKTE